MIEQWWQDLRDHVIPPGAGEAQARDMRVAYLSGCADVLKFIGSLEKTEANRRVLEKLVVDVNQGIRQILDSLPAKEKSS